MKIIIKYILTNVKERKTRTAVMLLSIILSTTLLFVSLSVGSSYESAQRKMARGMAGSATISITAKEGFAKLEDIPNLSSINSMAGIIETGALYHENGYYETIDLYAADLDELSKINKPRMKDGGEIENFSSNQIILPDRFTSKFNIKEGDSVVLQIGGEPVTLRVADIAAYDTVFLRNTRGSNGLLPKDTLKGLLNIADEYSEILIEPDSNTTTEELAKELTDKLSSDKYNVSVIVNEAQIAADAREKSMPFFLISFFSLTMSVFIIFSSYKVITLERLPVIGTFRSIGATKKMVTHILLIESLFYGVSGGILGIPIGVIVLKIMLQGLGESLSGGIDIPIVISLWGILLSLAVAIIVSLLSAYIPVKRASNLPVKDVVLGVAEEKNISNNKKLAIGVILMIASIILPKIASGKMLYIAGGFSLLGLIIATIIVIPLITSLAAILFEVVYSVVFGNIGKLAANNLRKNKNITQNISLLFISISSIIAISVVGDFVTSYIGDVFHGAKLEGFADASMNREFVDKVKNIEGIEEVLPVYVNENGAKCNGITFSRLEATNNLSEYNAMFAISYESKSKEENAVNEFTTERTIILSSDYMDKNGFDIGDIITLIIGEKSFDYKVVGRFESRANDTEAIIWSENYISDFGEDNYGILVYTAADPDAVMIQIRDLFGDTSNWSRTVEEFNSDALGTINAFLSPMHKMTYFILLLATVGIINNLLINYIQKRRAIAMYKSVGLSNRQNIKMTLIEGFSAGLLGALIGIVISYMEVQTIFLVVGPKINISPELDLMTFLTAGLLGIFITLIGSVIPILKSRKMKLVEEIKFE